MAQERVFISPDAMQLNDSSGNRVFDTNFKYIKTDTAGNMVLAALASSPVPFCGLTDLKDIGGHPIPVTFDPSVSGQTLIPYPGVGMYVILPTLLFSSGSIGTANNIVQRWNVGYLNSATTSTSTVSIAKITGTGGGYIYVAAGFPWSAPSTSGTVIHNAPARFQESGKYSPQPLAYYIGAPYNDVWTLTSTITLNIRFYASQQTLPLRVTV